MQHDERDAFRLAVMALRAAVDQVCAILDRSPVSPPVRTSRSPLRVDRRTFTVHWGKRRCRLGCTRSFRLIERLELRANQYVDVERLMQDLWSDPPSRAAVRCAVRELRSRLRRSGLADLADRIDGRNAGHYGLILSED